MTSAVVLGMYGNKTILYWLAYATHTTKGGTHPLGWI